MNNEVKQATPMRYERKFLVTKFSHLEIEQLIKYNAACFKPEYHERNVNNIYFDTLSFESYYGNVNGETERTKARIRWYGNLFGEIVGSNLEFKIKKGLLGKKESFLLNPFSLDKHFSKREIIRALSSEKLPSTIKNDILSMQPTLLNTYSRKYFTSADRKFRLTVDKQLQFYGISYNKNTFLNKSTSDVVVIELKYDSSLEEEAKEIANRFPFEMTKNSKYLQGIERVLF